MPVVSDLTIQTCRSRVLDTGHRPVRVVGLLGGELLLRRQLDVARTVSGRARELILAINIRFQRTRTIVRIAGGRRPANKQLISVR
jgi:hypothetical protein